MKIKLYFGVLALLWVLGSCTGLDKNQNISYDFWLGNVSTTTIEGHTYYVSSRSMAHSGSCLKCKQELDSIVRNAVNEAFEASMKENWNE